MASRPNFSGRWQVDFHRSKLEIDAPTSSVFVIWHEDPSLALTRTHKAGGYEDTFSLVLSTDGRLCVHHKGEAEIRSTCVWEGTSLRFRSDILFQGARAENVVVYSQSEDGQEITADETYTGLPCSYHNHWVLVRQPDRRGE